MTPFGCYCDTKTCEDSQKPGFFETTLSAFIAGYGVLTAHRLKHITSSSSWRPASADTGHGAKLPEDPTKMALSGENGTWINGKALDEETCMDRLAEFLSSREFWLPVAVAVLVLVLFIPFLLSLRRRLRSRLEIFWKAAEDDRLVHTRMANKTLDNLIPEIISITADKLLQDEVDDIEHEGGKLLKRIAAEAEDKEVRKELNGREVTFREDVASTSLMSKYISIA